MDAQTKFLYPSSVGKPPTQTLFGPSKNAQNTARWVLWFVGLAVLYAVVMRFWNLAAKPLHHDESLFAYYSYFLARGYGYQYQPILHGPILEHVTALVFLLFGDSDLTMRLPAAVGSLALFPLAWYWRRYLGQTGMIVSFLLLAVSPTILYYSRFLRNDAPYLAATVWCALCVLRAFETGQSRYFWGGLFAATIMFCMMESSIFFFAACLGYFAVIVMFDLVRGLGCDPNRPKQFPGTAVFFVPKERSGHGHLTRELVPVVGGVGWALVLGAAAAYFYVRVLSDSLPLPGWRREGTVWIPGFSQRWWDAFVLGAPLCAVLGAIAGASWRRVRGERGVLHYVLHVAWRNRWAILGGLGLGLLLFTTLFTTFFTHTEGPDFYGNTVRWTPLQIYKNTWDYWWDQHKLHRIKGPFHYYLPILLLYEFPAVMIVLVGWLRSLFAKRALLHFVLLMLPQFVLFLLLRGPLSDLDWAGYMDPKFHVTSPWHLHFALAYVQILTHVAGVFFVRGKYAESFLTFWTITSLFAYSYAGEKVPWLSIHTTGPLVLLAGYYLGKWIERKEWTPPRRWLWGGVATLALLWQVRSDFWVAFINSSSPAERIVYNHTSPDIVQAVREIERLAHDSGYGKQLPMLIKGEMEWPLYWYLRHYTNWGPSVDESVEETSRPVVLVDWERADAENLTNNYEIVRLKVREWWEPPLLDFRALSDIWRILTPRESRQNSENGLRLAAARREWRKLWRYLAYREIWLDPASPAYSNGANEFALCIRKDILAAIRSWSWHARMPMRRDVPIAP